MKTYPYILTILLLAFTVACGGGGSDSTSLSDAQQNIGSNSNALAPHLPLPGKLDPGFDRGAWITGGSGSQSAHHQLFLVLDDCTNATRGAINSQSNQAMLTELEKERLGWNLFTPDPGQFAEFVAFAETTLRHNLELRVGLTSEIPGRGENTCYVRLHLSQESLENPPALTNIEYGCDPDPACVSDAASIDAAF